MNKNTKLTATVERLLMVLVVFLYVHWISRVGIVLFLMAMYTLSKTKNEPVLFREALLAFLIPGIGGVLLGIIGGIIGAIVGWIFAIVHGVKMQKVSLILENHLNNSNFKVASTLFFWGDGSHLFS